MLVSAVIVNYNYSRFFAEAIDSVLDQTYPDVEVIVVDDGSTDDSRDIIAGYGDRIIPIFKENGGHASAFNAGFAAGRGELVCFLDSDDVWLPTKVAEVAAAAMEDPHAVLVYHQVRHAEADGTPANRVIPPVVLQGSINSMAARSGAWWQFPPTSGLCFRQTFLNRVMPVPEERYRRYADPYLADVAPFLGPVYGIPAALALYRQHQNSHSNTQSIASRMRIYESRVDGLNDALSRLNADNRVSLMDNWPYQRLRYLSGHGNRLSLIAMTRLGLYRPSEPRFAARIKSVLRLWLDSGRKVLGWEPTRW